MLGSCCLLPLLVLGENAAWPMSGPDGTGLREGTAAWKASPSCLLILPSLPRTPVTGIT